MSRPLEPSDRVLLERLAGLVVVNPFGARRAALERELEPAGPERTRTARTVARASAHLARLAAQGVACLQDVTAEERESLSQLFLFEVYHAGSEALDGVIAAQEAAPEEPCAVPSAGALLERLRARGFAPDEAAKNLGLFYQLRRAYTFIDRALVGSSACMQALREALWNDIFTADVRHYGAWLWRRMEDFSTLLLGETGTGKGSAAGAIGRSAFIPFDPRRGRFGESFARAFVSLNLSEFPESLIESALFGHERGAFTGATEKREGVFALSSPHGAILLDEIGELSQPVQIKLLRVLQERLYTPVGSRRTRRFSGRVIAATNRPLEELRGGCLRSDFFYRLCSDVIVVPPLRQRLAEAPGELEHLVRELVQRLLGAPAEELVTLACEAIERDLGRAYPWPGNVRELEQAVRRILLKGRYEGLRTGSGDDVRDAYLEATRRGELDADQLLAGYCARLHAESGSYQEVARRTRLDRRTVRRYVELAPGGAPGPTSKASGARTRARGGLR